MLFEALSIVLSADDFERVSGWDLILLTVSDKQMAVQLNKLSAYMPHLKFVISPDSELFSLRSGDEKRRVWK